MKTILVVDDDTDLRETVAQALTDDGYDVQMAANGEDALTKLSSMTTDEPSLVLLDLTMPVMTGTELLGVLLSQGRLPNLPIIVFSSRANEAEGLGARRLMRKPVTLATLLSTVHEVCGRA